MVEGSATASSPTTLADRLAGCYTGVVYDVLRGRGITECILPPTILPLDLGMVARLSPEMQEDLLPLVVDIAEGRSDGAVEFAMGLWRSPGTTRPTRFTGYRPARPSGWQLSPPCSSSCGSD